MSYQVLARKYRPSNFKELEGQSHVLQALINALDNDRLHHAYLFTGTRGVGKTTIARILAKCLNCEQGVTSEPCGTCHACMEIAEGRSVDLIEVDAASRTGVDDMRDLLDNVQYMPTSARYKVYLIDEVHMLSKSSFNAMLKTLEEPPAHVKFLFATTDPKKLPVTVLSRCLQFNLKNMTPERVVNHLREILGREGIEAEDAALWQLGRAAEGSMRDALSLTDQAIGFCDGALTEQSVAAMLGTVDRQDVYRLLVALAEYDGGQLLQIIAQAAEFSTNFDGLLDEVLAVLHRVAIAHAVPDSIDNQLGDEAVLRSLTELFDPEHVQLLYQIGLIGKRDLPLSPSPQIGFEMVMLRMLAFQPEAGPTDEHREPADRGDVSDAPASDASESPLANLKASLASGAKGASAPTTGSVPRATQMGSAMGAVKTDSYSADATTPAKAAAAAVKVASKEGTQESLSVDGSQSQPSVRGAGEREPTKAVTHQQQGTAEALVDLSAEDASLSPNPHQKEDALATEGSGSSRQNLYVVEGGRSSKTGLNPETEEGSGGVPRASENVQFGDQPGAMPALTKGPEDTLSRAGLEHGDEPLEIEGDQGSSPVQGTRQAVFDEPFAPGDVAWFERFSALVIGGVAEALASHLHWVERAGNCIQFTMDPEYASLMGDQQVARLEAALSTLEGEPITIQISVEQATGASPAMIAADRKARALARARADIERDPGVQVLMTSFGAKIVEDTVKPKTVEGDR
jgi:DNA polymerase-3 subunit gamma/tau